MAEASIYARILSLVADLSGETGLTPQTRLKADLGLDSIELVQLVLALDRSFGVAIHSAEVTPEHFDSLGSIAEFIEQKQVALAAQQSAE